MCQTGLLEMSQRPSKSDARRSIYRADAVARYARGRDKSVLPRLVSPRVVTWLWILLCLLLMSGFIFLLPLMDHLLSE